MEPGRVALSTASLHPTPQLRQRQNPTDRILRTVYSRTRYPAVFLHQSCRTTYPAVTRLGACERVLCDIPGDSVPTPHSQRLRL